MFDLILIFVSSDIVKLIVSVEVDDFDCIGSKLMNYFG